MLQSNQVIKKRIVLNGVNEYNGSPQQFCFDFDVIFNRHGNIAVIVDKVSPSFIPFFRSKLYVFSRDGVCISHLPSKKYKRYTVNALLVESHS